MAGLGTAVAFLLLLWCSLLYVPFRWRPVGIYLITWKARYAEASALTYVDAECPPTLLMHGTHDEMAPVAAVRQLQARLEQVGVPVTAVYLPHTDHMFDLAGTKWSPAARVAIYALERFLVVVSATEPRPAAHA